MWKWQLSEQNGLWRPSMLSHTHGHAPGAISQFSRVAEQVIQHLREERSTGTTCFHLFFSLGTEPSSREQEVWEGCVKGRKPASEPAPGAMELQATAC